MKYSFEDHYFNKLTKDLCAWAHKVTIKNSAGKTVFQYG